jgi:hypothetical protein
MKRLLFILIIAALLLGCTEDIELDDEDEISDFIVSNPLDLTQIESLSVFRSCAGHDYSGLNTQGERESLRSMKHYINLNKELIGQKDTVKIFAPFDGEISQITDSNPGFYLYVSNKEDWDFIFFHVEPLQDITKGTEVKAGQLLGYAADKLIVNFDMGLKQFGYKGQIFESPFLHMNQQVLEQYKSKGVTKENIIVSKEFRDNNPCPLAGTSKGDVNFAQGIRSTDYVTLKSN